MRAGTWPGLTARAKSWLALATTISLLAVACDGGADRGGTSATPSDTAFLDPIANPRDIRDLFVVEADDGEYWRFFTLDTYDGMSWTGVDPTGSIRGVLVSSPAMLPQQGAEASPATRILDQTFRILSDVDRLHALPMAQTAEEIDGSLGEITWDAARAVAFVDAALEEGTTYTIRSRIVVPTPEELDRVEFLAPSIYGRWTALPKDLDPRIAEIAADWTAGATSAYRKVLAIQERFQQRDFVYSTDVGLTDRDADLVEFLTRTKTGFFEHYSSAMAVMVRTLGLPARIGGGFRAGTRQEGGSFLVTTEDVHVWVEVLFPGYGWLQFEPEHGTAHPNAQPGTYLNPS